MPCFLVHMFLAYNELVIVRYIYICRMGTFGTLKEGVLLHFFAWLNTVLALFGAQCLAVTSHLSTHSLYHFCANTMPTAKGMIIMRGNPVK